MKQNDYCFILKPIADHQGSTIPFRECRWTGPYISGPNESYIVRKLNSNETQILHRIRLCKYEPNSAPQDVRLEGNLQPDDEIIIPQDDLYVITWETNFGKFSNSAEEIAIPTSQDGLGTCDTGNDALTPDEIFTDVDLRSIGSQENGARAPAEILNDEDLGSTGPHETDDFVSLEKNPIRTHE